MATNNDSRLEEEVEFRDTEFNDFHTIKMEVNEDSGRGQIQIRNRHGEFVNKQISGWMSASQRESERITQGFGIESKRGEDAHFLLPVDNGIQHMSDAVDRKIKIQVAKELNKRLIGPLILATSTLMMIAALLSLLIGALVPSGVLLAISLIGFYSLWIKRD